MSKARKHRVPDRVLWRVVQPMNDTSRHPRKGLTTRNKLHIGWSVAPDRVATLCGQEFPHVPGWSLVIFFAGGTTATCSLCLHIARKDDHAHAD